MPTRPAHNRYSLAEFVEAYGGSVEAPPAEWLDAAGGTAADDPGAAAPGNEEVEKRADPDAGPRSREAR